MSREHTDVVSCKSCGADIVFLRTVNGKNMPVNADTVEPGDVDYEHGRHVAHWATCPQASQHRRRDQHDKGNT